MQVHLQSCHAGCSLTAAGQLSAGRRHQHTLPGPGAPPPKPFCDPAQPMGLTSRGMHYCL